MLDGLGILLSFVSVGTVANRTEESDVIALLLGMDSRFCATGFGNHVRPELVMNSFSRRASIVRERA
jgi:hypothetical protein